MTARAARLRREPAAGSSLWRAACAVLPARWHIHTRTACAALPIRFDDRTWYPLGRVIGGTVYPVRARQRQQLLQRRVAQ